MDKKMIGDAIYSGIKRKKINKSELAKHFSVTKSAVGQWISGESCPSGDKLLAIIEYLDIYNDVFGRQRPETEDSDKNKELQNLKGWMKTEIDSLREEVRQVKINKALLVAENSKFNSEIINQTGGTLVQKKT